jgi:GTP-binding protein Era
MNAAAQDALIDADVVLWLVDISENPHAEDRIIAERLKGVQAVIQALNKIDLIKDADTLAHKRSLFQELLPSIEQIMISAVEGTGFDALRERILTYLPEGPPLYPEDQITDLYEREIAADLIREAALNNLRHTRLLCVLMNIRKGMKLGRLLLPLFL